MLVVQLLHDYNLQGQCFFADTWVPWKVACAFQQFLQSHNGQNDNSPLQVAIYKSYVSEACTPA
jgi:hypothetical protein